MDQHPKISTWSRFWAYVSEKCSDIGRWCKEKAKRFVDWFCSTWNKLFKKQVQEEKRDLQEAKRTLVAA